MTDQQRELLQDAITIISEVRLTTALEPGALLQCTYAINRIQMVLALEHEEEKP